MDDYRRLDDALRAAREQTQALRERHRVVEAKLHRFMTGHPRALISDGSSVAAATITSRAPITKSIVVAALQAEGVDRTRISRVLERVQTARSVTVRPCISRRFYAS